MKSLHADEEINFIRIRSLKHEIMIAPEKEFSLIVLQNPSNDETNWEIFNFFKNMEKYANFKKSHEKNNFS